MTRTPKVIGEIAPLNAQRAPDAEAIVDGTRRLSWEELWQRTTRLRGALANELSVAPGDRVAYLGRSCLEAFELCHAVPGLGALHVPLNERLAEAELARIMAVTTPRALIHDEAAAALAARLSDPAGVPRIGVRTPATYDYDELLRRAPETTPPSEVDPLDAASICFTSGTTGVPKGVIMRHGAQLAFAAIETELEPIGPAARHLFARPMAVAPGHRLAAWHGLNAGATILMPRFEPAEFFRVVENEHITNVLLAPTMLRMLLDEGNRGEHDLSSLQAIVYGGAPMPDDLLAEVLAFFSCRIVQGYGSSEAGQVLCLSDEDHRTGHLDTHGRPVAGVELQIRDSAGQQVPSGDVGELHVRSPQLAAGYWRDPERSAAVFVDGWYHTGDLAAREADGRYRVVGRASDLIITGGFNVVPREVEQVIASHAAVREVAVFGVKDRTWGEAVHAAVVLELEAAVTAEELIEHCRAHLASFKKPRRIDFLDALPLTTAGKIDKMSLAKRSAGAAVGPPEPAGRQGTSPGGTA
jgi:acyl-CoA synthetase (AMP-forming)/AMP-acid ligase II